MIAKDQRPKQTKANRNGQTIPLCAPSLSCREQGNSRPPMDPLEYCYTRVCGADGEDEVGDEFHPRCILDLLWWARPPEVDGGDPLAAFSP